MASANNMLEEIMNDISEIEGISLNQHITLIPTGVDLLDKIAGGGIPVGKLVAIAGSPGGGKSTLACEIIASFNVSIHALWVFMRIQNKLCQMIG